MPNAEKRLSRVETELEARTEELAEAQRIAKLGLWRWNLRTNDFSWSEEVYRLLGLNPESFQVTLESTLRCIHPDDREATMAKLMATISQRQPQSHEYRALASDGAVLHFWSSTRLVLDEQGEPAQITGVCQDVTGRVLAEAALRESEDHYRHAVELSPHIPWTADPDGNVLEIGPRCLEQIGIPQEEALGQGWSKALHPDDVASTLAAWGNALSTGNNLDMEYRVRLCEGTYNWMRVRAAARRDDTGTIIRWYGTLEDIQAQKLAQLALSESEARLRSVLASTTDSVILVDHEWRITYLNPKAIEVLGERTDVALGANLLEAYPEEVGTTLHKCLLEAASARQAVQLEAFLQRAGLWLDVHAYPTSDGLSLFFRDVTEARRTREELTYLAHHDVLTGLPNRAYFVEQLNNVLDEAARSNREVGLIYLDLDDFKVINDTLGHHAGDAVLIEVARRLGQLLPSASLISRLGGDEFAVLLAGGLEGDLLECTATLLTDGLSEPVVYNGTQLSCKASVGIALFPQSDSRPAELLKNADLALYKAKRSGGNQHAYFSPEVRQVMQQRLSGLSCAREALARNAIVPFYQPKVSFATGEVCGFEALLRWTGPDGRIYPPGLIRDAFVDPLLAVQLGKRMLDQVICDMQTWKEAGLNFGHVALNVAPPEFQIPFADSVLAALRAARLEPCELEIEVTETVFLGDGSDLVAATLRKLHDNGVSIALDDFGTGYASLTHLSKFPVSSLKIDQSFVREMRQSAEAAAIVKAVIGLARSLGIQVIAEGVETLDQWRELKKRGCDCAQGYLIAKAMNADGVPKFLQTWEGLQPRAKLKSVS